MRRIPTRTRDRRASSRGRGPALRLGRGRRLRLGRRLSRGLSLFGALLALGLLGMLVLGATVFFETRALEERGRLAAVQLAVLAEATATYAHSRFPALLARAGAGPSEIALAALKADGALTDEFSETDALGRGYRVLVLAGGADAFDVLVTETVSAGDTVRPAAALLEAPGPRMGLAGPSRLSGPTVDADLAAFRAAFAGAPREGALAALRRFDHGSVYGDQLYRVAIPGFAEANRMEADLDMGGNAIEGAGTIEAASLEVKTDLEAGGDLAVTGDLLVGRALRVAGTVEAEVEIAAAAARIEGLVRVRLALASQRLDDFGGALAELANRYWILGSGGKAKEAEALTATFSLTDTLSDAIRYRLTGPGRDGAPALLIASGQGGRFEQLLVNTPGPVELWALTTSPADVALRRRLYALLPPDRARAALARAFPEGTARSRIERELARMDSPEAGRAASEEAVLDRLADEVARAAGNEPPHSAENAT